MIVVDAHEDIAYNAICYHRDYRASALDKRRAEAGTEVTAHVGTATVGLPESLSGRVAVVFTTIFVAPASPQSSPWNRVKYKTPGEAYRLGREQVDYYQRVVDETERIRFIKTKADLAAVLATWEADADPAKRQQGWVMLMENADPIVEPRQFEEWYERGVRLVGPAWEATRYCGGTGQPGPLTALGRELLDIMSGFNALLDLSHMAEQSFFEAIDHYEGQVIASHSSPRHFVNTDRHLSDDMIRKLAERDGVMGVVLYNRFLKQGWQKRDGKAAVPFSLVLDVVDYICQLTGSAAHVGLGSDFDGGFGAESTPEGIDTVTDLWTIGDGLRERGYSEDDIAAVLGGNLLRKLRQTLP
jgi:membrane dipeptidase